MEKYKLIFEQWLKHFESCKEETKILRSYKEWEIQKYFSNKKFTFGTAGVRKKIGLSPQKLNLYTYRLLAEGYAKYIQNLNNKNNLVIVAHDNRENGEIYCLAIAEVLIKNKIKVILAPNNEILPTPILSFWIRKLKCSGGINVTASHNPPIYNGFKTYNSTGSQTNSLEEEIIIQNLPDIENIFEIKYEKNANFDYLPTNYISVYFDKLKKYLKNENFDKKFKILFSSHHGTSTKIMKNFAFDLGYTGFEEYLTECNLNKKINKNEVTNPEEIESFNFSKIEAEKKNINYLLAHDPDSDRAGFMEKQKNGEWYLFNGNEMAILFVYYFINFYPKNKKNQYIVSSFVSGDYVQKFLNNKKNFFLTKTGFKNISRLVEEYEKTGQLLLAFEEAIGVLAFPINREKDAFQHSVILLNMISVFLSKKTSLKDTLNKIYSKYGAWHGSTDYFFSNSKEWKKIFALKIKILSEIKENLWFGYKIENIFFNEMSDSLEWHFFNKSWIKFRISGTEPKFKIYYNLYGENMQEIKKSFHLFQKYFKNTYFS